MRNQPPVSSGSPKAQELEETILAILPFPEPEELFNRIRARHPKSTVVYYQLPGSDIKSVEHYRVRDVDVPLGTCPLSILSEQGERRTLTTHHYWQSYTSARR